MPHQRQKNDPPSPELDFGEIDVATSSGDVLEIEPELEGAPSAGSAGTFFDPEVDFSDLNDPPPRSAPADARETRPAPPSAEQRAAARPSPLVPPPPPAPRTDELFAPRLPRRGSGPTEPRSAEGPPLLPRAAAAMGPEPEISFDPLASIPRALPITPMPGASTTREVGLEWADLDIDSLPTPAPLVLETPSHEEGDALSLVEKASVRPPLLAPPDPRQELRDRFALGDYSGALIVAEALLGEVPDDAQVIEMAEQCRAKLRQMYASRLGSLDQIPVMVVARSELKWLSLDHRAGFVLSLVDGTSTVEDIIDISGMPALEVLRTLFNLVTQKVIEMRPPRRARR